MRRRGYLGGLLGLGAVALGVAGLSGSESLPRWDPEGTAAAVAIGNRNSESDPEDARPHGIYIWNMQSAEREIGVRVERENPGGSETVLDREFAVPSDEALEITLVEPATYTVRIDLGWARLPYTITERREDFDCNSSSHQVFVRPSGRIQSQSFTTLVLCADRLPGSPTPE